MRVIRNVFKMPTRRETNISMHTQVKLTEPDQAVLITVIKSDHKM